MKTFYPALLFVLFSSSSCDNNVISSETENTPENGDLNTSFNEQQSEIEIQPEQKIQQEKEKLIADGWQEKDLTNGHLPNCYNFKPKIGDVDNSLEVYVGSGTDVAIKLMNLESNKCIRYVFINSGTNFSINNVPEGRYYLKIAYGKDWLSKVQNGQCVGKFIRNPMYEKGEDILDFNIKYSSDGYSIPSFSLKLDVISSDISNSFNSHKISENDFNQ